MHNNKVLAIIPARGGSKRIPRKNIRDFLGKPIIAYSIQAAVDSHIFDEIMVSTDDKEIAQVAEKYGAKVPFTRSAKNSDDNSTISQVMDEVVLDYKHLGKEFDYIFCIYPTAPFTNAEKLRASFELITKHKASAAVVVTRFNYPIQRSLKIEKDGTISMIWPENKNIRSQDLMPTYHDSGQYFCIKTNNLLKGEGAFIANTIPIVISESDAQDIDNEEDWDIAELKFKRLRSII